MLDTVRHILRLPLFPIVILALVAVLYWRGALTMRQQRKSRADAEKKLGDD